MGENGGLEAPPGANFFSAIREMWEISMEMPASGKWGNSPGNESMRSQFAGKFPGGSRETHFPGNSPGNTAPASSDVFR